MPEEETRLVTSPIPLTGKGIHSGRTTRIVLVPADGPVSFVVSGGRASIADLEIRRTDRGVRVARPDIGLDVDGVEHFLAALGGLGIREGVHVEIHGEEFPLLDGGALAFSRALLTVPWRESASPLTIAQGAEIRHGDSVYRFTPGSRPELHVVVEFDAPGIGRQSASCDGTATAFVENIAW